MSALATRYDYAVVGGGIIGLTIARELKLRFPGAHVCLVEKETDVAQHASGRNSGVLHAGFYYSADSLKARFTRDGNRAMAEYCVANGLPYVRGGKLVVAQGPEELQGLEELKRRGDRNGVELHWVDERDLDRYDANAATYKKALYSPNTGSVNPVRVCGRLRDEIAGMGVDLFFGVRYRRCRDGVMECAGAGGARRIRFAYLVNAAGLYADRIAHEWGFGRSYTILPFKGIYLPYTKNKQDVNMNIYPVPNLANPFLGVHFTKTVDGTIKIGPTAIPAFWRENYRGFANFRLDEFFSILGHEARLFAADAFHFRSLAVSEMKKYRKAHLISLSLKLVKHLDRRGFGPFLRPGIRAQLLNVKTRELVQDFVLEGDGRSMHVLNAVSPAFTCAFPFARHVVDQIVARRAAAPAWDGADAEEKGRGMA